MQKSSTSIIIQAALNSTAQKPSGIYNRLCRAFPAALCRAGSATDIKEQLFLSVSTGNTR
jgi:hypothetical protein